MAAKLTQDEVISSFKKKHGDKYSYDKVKYLGDGVKVQIYCKECREYFPQRPGSHKNGQGCPKCGVLRS